MQDTYTELYEKLSRLQWLLHRHHIINRAERGPFADATRGQGRVLAMLKLQPEISTKDLSYLLGIKVASLNELLTKLEKGEYIVRKPSETDKRVMIIHLTDKGRAQQQAATDYSGIFGCLALDEQAAFGDYLDRVIEALEGQIEADIDWEDMANWAAAARARMGDEGFERMLAMRSGPGRNGFGRNAPGRNGPGHDGHGRDGYGRQGRDPYAMAHRGKHGRDGCKHGPNGGHHDCGGHHSGRPGGEAPPPHAHDANEDDDQ